MCAFTKDRGIRNYYSRTSSFTFKYLNCLIMLAVAFKDSLAET